MNGEEYEEDGSFSCPGCGHMMDDQEMFDEHEPRCSDLEDEALLAAGHTVPAVTKHLTFLSEA